MQVYIARNLNPLDQVHGVVTFYSFKTQPRGKHTISFAKTACYVAESPSPVESKQMLNIG
jgi:NADH:ubiquinone oxidoreductase subunit E